MTKDSQIALLISIRNQIDVLLEEFIPDAEHPNSETCTHPKESRLNLSVLGSAPHFKCKDCGEEWTE